MNQTTTMGIVPQTIFEQLGGGRFTRMTGARNFIGDRNTLKFRIPPTRGVNHVEVKLNGRDLYDVRFCSVTRFGVKEKAKHFDIFADGLQELFTRETGLYTRI